jgi:predicted HTH transcriptional regulator
MNLEELKKNLARGENETFELKARIPSPYIVARHLASMANTRGGHLVFGVKKPAVFVGVNPHRISEVLESAARLLNPSPQILMTTFELEEKSIVALSVEPSAVLISAFDGYYTRDDDQTLALTAEEIKHHALDERSPDTALSMLSAAVAAQTRTIDKLHTEFEKVNSIWKKIGFTVAGAIAGAIAKHLLDIWLG